MTTKRIMNILFSSLFSAFIFFPLIAFAGPNEAGTAQPVNQAGEAQPVSCTGDSCKLTNPLSPNGGVDITPQQLIGRIINAVLGIVGSLALAMFIYGGFTWMMAGGGAEAVKKGKDIIIWATIGLVVIFSSYALVKFVLSSVVGIK